MLGEVSFVIRTLLIAKETEQGVTITLFIYKFVTTNNHFCAACLRWCNPFLGFKVKYYLLHIKCSLHVKQNSFAKEVYFMSDGDVHAGYLHSTAD